ncbi:MAG: cobalamin biosynthesis protein [Propioniciclava sp.]|uniref:cobalamin biosynthesis protein n=1 Tax=Propioniciclava sp. TaxID=2038686 RepID=UPI0039E53477
MTLGHPARARSLGHLVGARALGLVLGVTADALIGDPRRFHPVAGFGTFAAAVERRIWADRTVRGGLHVALTVGPVVALGVASERLTRGRPVARMLTTAVATWASLGAHSLAREGRLMADALDSGDLDAARARLSHLCGRAPEGLDAEELGRATVESLAENTNDAVVAPLFWAATCGVPGVLGHRAINTLDAMVGHRSARYARFGSAAARLDDASAWLSARVTGGLACLLAPMVGGSRTEAWRVMRRDAHDHPSPNGGWCESAWAGALGVRLGGRNVYHGRVEVRGRLGDPSSPRPDADAVRRAARLVTGVTAAATALAAASVVKGSWLARKRPSPNDPKGTACRAS